MVHMAKKRRKKIIREEKIEESKPKRQSKKKHASPMNNNLILTVIAVVVVAAVAWYVGTLSAASQSPEVGGDVVAGRVVSFLQSKLSPNYPGINVQLAGVEEYANITGTYEVKVNVTFQGKSQVIPYYATGDGKQLFTIIGNLEEKLPPQNTNTQPANQGGDVCSQLGVTKSDKPAMYLFIMSHCPGGLQMQKAFLPVMDLLGDKADMRVKWVYYIMHGEKDLKDNSVQECIQMEFPDKYVDYAECFTTTGDSDSCLTKAGITKSLLDTCIADLDTRFNITGMYNDKSTWLSGRYPLYPVYADENQKYGVAGSPTVVLNGKIIDVNRSPEAVKQALCCAFTNPPPECSQTLSSAVTSPGIGGGTGTNTGASCS